MVVAMADQAHKALPELAGRPFAEKPPLLYWLGGAAVAAFGPAPGAARLPNFGYLLLAVFAMATLAGAAAGRTAAFATGIVTASALQLYYNAIWLATDAPLLAGVALALAGAHAGLVATATEARRRGYLVFHAGLLVAFFAKGFAGWMVPLLAYATVIVAERRWRELLAPELWRGVPLLLVAIGLWVLWVSRSPGGPEALRVLFWYNLVGRAVTITAPAEFAYAGGHQNSAGKYLLELPLYLLPWTALAVAALAEVPRRWREHGPRGTALRLALGAIVPATLLLSLAATARGVYYGPPALGFALLIGLGEAGGAYTSRAGAVCFQLTRLLTALLAGLVTVLALLATCAPVFADGMSLALGAVALVGGGAALTLVLYARGRLAWLALAVTLVLSAGVGPLYHEFNRWQSLEVVAGRIEAAAAGRPLVVLGADETTLALASLYVPAAQRAALIPAEARDADALARDALTRAGGEARVLWLVPERRRWNAAAWRAFLGYGAAPAPHAAAGDMIVLPEGLGPLRVEALIERPGGRRYALLAALPVATDSERPQEGRIP
jgi:4-amino-4-deoxy-L-arabinose transferase-like glycosyltransferase